MTKRNSNGVQINESVTITEVAGAAITDCRNKIMAYDENGNVILATDGTAMPVGIAIIEAGINDISGEESGKIAAGDDVDIQIKDIGYVLAGAAVTKGNEVTAMDGGVATPATAGNYVLGVALSDAKVGEYCRVQISKYQKNPAEAGN